MIDMNEGLLTNQNWFRVPKLNPKYTIQFDTTIMKRY
jgi:hypothetical protein